MLKIINKFNAKLTNHNYRILWAEGVVLSVIIGSGFASWPGAIVLLAVLMWVLDRRWGSIYLIGFYSCAWGFLAGMIGYGLGGWAWALLLGLLALRSGIKIHCRDLKRPFVNASFENFNANQWRQNWLLGPQNLN